jgi:molybdenum cofactor cytidylyltransferase/nicotine blue oxidoreductase
MTSLGKQSGPTNLRLAVLLLAAGKGSRLGLTPKALLQKDGQSLLSHFCQAISTFVPTEFLVVTGFYADAIESELAQLKKDHDIPIKTMHNPNPERGQTSSVRLGLESLKSDYDVLLVALCDQPLVGTTEINTLLKQFEQRDQQKEIMLPMVGEHRGNPVVFSRQVIADILAIPKMVCRPFMDQHPELVQIFATNNPAYISDADTEADLSTFNLKRF